MNQLKQTCLVNLNVWRANSLVGDIISARGPLLLPDLFSFSCKRCNIGNKKAAVLPLPVLAMATTSLPNNISGIAYLNFGINLTFYKIKRIWFENIFCLPCAELESVVCSHYLKCFLIFAKRSLKNLTTFRV